MCLFKNCLCRIEKDNLFFYKLVLNRIFYKDINNYIISFLRPDYRYDYNKVIDNFNKYHLFINIKLFNHYNITKPYKYKIFFKMRIKNINKSYKNFLKKINIDYSFYEINNILLEFY